MENNLCFFALPRPLIRVRVFVCVSVCVCCLCRCVQLGLHLNLTTKFLVCIFFWTCSDSFSSARLI